jgi:hypothetical protein
MWGTTEIQRNGVGYCIRTRWPVVGHSDPRPISLRISRTLWGGYPSLLDNTATETHSPAPRRSPACAPAPTRPIATETCGAFLTCSGEWSNSRRVPSLSPAKLPPLGAQFVEASLHKRCSQCRTLPHRNKARRNPAGIHRHRAGEGPEVGRDGMFVAGVSAIDYPSAFVTGSARWS